MRRSGNFSSSILVVTSTYQYSFVDLVGSGSDVSRKYGAGGIPRVFLIDKDGVVRYFHGGWSMGMDLTPEVRRIVE